MNAMLAALRDHPLALFLATPVSVRRRSVALRRDARAGLHRVHRRGGNRNAASGAPRRLAGRARSSGARRPDRAAEADDSRPRHAVGVESPLVRRLPGERRVSDRRRSVCARSSRVVVRHAQHHEGLWRRVLAVLRALRLRHFPLCPAGIPVATDRACRSPVSAQ